jgi:hypothetical protein
MKEEEMKEIIKKRIEELEESNRRDSITLNRKTISTFKKEYLKERMICREASIQELKKLLETFGNSYIRETQNVESNTLEAEKGKVKILQKLREKWFKKTHKVKGEPKIWMWEDDWNKMIDKYEELIE